LLGVLLTQGCASLVSRATSDMAANLSAAILNQRDPAVVRDGAPAYLLMLDSLVEGHPDDPATLRAATELYAMYGALFAGDPGRGDLLTSQALAYGERALCATDQRACGLDSLHYPDYLERLNGLRATDAPALYSYGLAWVAYVRVNSAKMSALAKLPRAQATFERIQQLDPAYQAVNVQHYLAVLDTVRPPAIGGDFDRGKEHFERALQLSGGNDLSILVDYARYYARTLYERDLHDRLLHQVLDANPVQQGHTLFNVLAQQQARELLDSADDYF